MLRLRISGAIYLPCHCGVDKIKFFFIFTSMKKVIEVTWNEESTTLLSFWRGTII
jgi:hypothetical protein